MAGTRACARAILLLSVVSLALSAEGETAAVVESNEDGDYDIHIVQQSTPSRLTHNQAQDRQPVLSHDGLLIAFSSDRDGNSEIYVMDSDGRNQVRLTDHPGTDVFPAWTACDSSIVFVSDRDGQNDLYIMGRAGQEQRVLTVEESRRTLYEPSWDAGLLARNSAPQAWLQAVELRPRVVRLHLAGTRDREDGSSLTGTLSFGDQTDTLFAHVPPHVDHLYAEDGSYPVRLWVEDSRGLGASVVLDLVLQNALRVPRPDIQYERGYEPKRLDREE